MINSFVRGNSLTCIGCRTCMIGCVVAHEGLEIFYKSPEEYVFNPKLDIVKTAEISIAVQCKHCENPACLESCPTGAISRAEGAVVVDGERCIGCKTCMVACPYGAVNMVSACAGSERIIANKCDLCYKRDGGPECVKVCPTRSLRLVTEGDLKDSNQNKRKSAAAGLDNRL